MSQNVPIQTPGPFLRPDTRDRFPFEIDVSHLTALDRTHARMWCEQQFGPGAVDLWCLNDRTDGTYSIVFRFREQADAVFFTLTWL